MEKTIEMKGVDLGSFFGPADTNLKLIESLFSSKIIARGNLIKIIGDEEEVNTISQIFHEMASALNEKGTLELSDVETLLTFNSSTITFRTAAIGTEIIIPRGPKTDPPTITTIITNIGCRPTESDIIKGEEIKLSIN